MTGRLYPEDGPIHVLPEPIWQPFLGPGNWTGEYKRANIRAARGLRSLRRSWLFLSPQANKAPAGVSVKLKGQASLRECLVRFCPMQDRAKPAHVCAPGWWRGWISGLTRGATASA